MKQFEDVLISAFFTEDELVILGGIFSTSLHQYMIDLDVDPFAHDYTDEDLKDEVEKILDGKSINADESDIKMLVNQLRYKLI